MGLAGSDGGFQGGGGVGQGEGRGALFREPGDVDEAHFGGGSGVVVQQAVEGVVADEGAGGIGNLAGEGGLPDGGFHGQHRDGGKIGGGAVLGHELAHGLVSGVVGDFGIPDVHADALRGHGGPASGLSDAQDHVGLDFGGRFQHLFGGQAKDRGDFQLMDFKIGDGVRQQLHRLPGGVDGCASEGVEAGDEKFTFHVGSSCFIG